MPPKTLTWIFAGLFLLFGIAMAFAGDPALRRLLAGLSCLALGGFTVSMVLDAVASGEMRLRHSVVRRAGRPALFWSLAVSIVAAGLGVVTAGLWLLFFRV